MVAREMTITVARVVTRTMARVMARMVAMVMARSMARKSEYSQLIEYRPIAMGAQFELVKLFYINQESGKRNGGYEKSIHTLGNDPISF